MCLRAVSLVDAWNERKQIKEGHLVRPVKVLNSESDPYPPFPQALSSPFSLGPMVRSLCGTGIIGVDLYSFDKVENKSCDDDNHEHQIHSSSLYFLTTLIT